MKKEIKPKAIRVGDIVQNIKTKSLYRVIEDKQPKESFTQVRFSELTKDYALYQPKQTTKLRKYYAEVKRNLGS